MIHRIWHLYLITWLIALAFVFLVAPLVERFDAFNPVPFRDTYARTWRDVKKDPRLPVWWTIGAPLILALVTLTLLATALHFAADALDRFLTWVRG